MLSPQAQWYNMIEKGDIQYEIGKLVLFLSPINKHLINISRKEKE